MSSAALWHRRRPLCPHAAATFYDGGSSPPRRAYVRLARPGDGRALHASLREADRRELEALGRDPREAIDEAVALSQTPLTAIAADGRLALMFGAAPAPWIAETGPSLKIGAPWMLASPALEAISRPFLRACRGWVDRLGAPFDLLANCVDERNALHIRWLRWSGFSVLRRVALGPEARPFLEFARLGGGDVFATPETQCAKEQNHV